jgi:hypothetical protein
MSDEHSLFSLFTIEEGENPAELSEDKKYHLRLAERHEAV